MGWIKGKPMDPIVIRDGVGKRITDLRLGKEMTQRDLAKRCGINRVSIQMYEVGRYTPHTPNLQKIADALDTTIEYLISGDDYRKHYQIELKGWRTRDPMGRIICPYCGKGNGYEVRRLKYDCLPMPRFCAWCGRKVDDGDI